MTRNRTQEEGLVLESHGESTHQGAETGAQMLCAAGRQDNEGVAAPCPSEKSFGKAGTDERGRRLRRKDRGVATSENSCVTERLIVLSHIFDSWL